MRASLVVEHLASLLRAKAGVAEPSPAAEFEAEMRAKFEAAAEANSSHVVRSSPPI